MCTIVTWEEHAEILDYELGGMYDEVVHYNGTIFIGINEYGTHFIDPEGELIRFAPEYSMVWKFNGELALVQYNDKYDAKYGFIDGDAREVIPCVFDEVKFLKSGYIKVSMNGKWGCYSNKGERVLDIIYDTVSQNGDESINGYYKYNNQSSRKDTFYLKEKKLVYSSNSCFF